MISSKAARSEAAKRRVLSSHASWPLSCRKSFSSNGSTTGRDTVSFLADFRMYL